MRTTPDQPLEQRLAHLHDGIVAAIATHRPVLVAVERVLFSKNVRTAMATGHAAGVVMLAAAQAGLPVVQLTPTDVKASVAGDGAADKDGVARMVVAQLGLAAPPRPADAADALAVALAALSRMRTTGLAGAAPAGRAALPPPAGSRSWPTAGSPWPVGTRHRRHAGSTMIAHVRGRVSHRGTEFVVVDVGGVGYLVHVASLDRVPPRGEDVELHTSLQVREDSMTLYGFPDRADLELFDLLLTSSGVGPKLALAALRTHRADVLRTAIATGDVATLTAVPGIGKKSA